MRGVDFFVFVIVGYASQLPLRAPRQIAIDFCIELVEDRRAPCYALHCLWLNLPPHRHMTTITLAGAGRIFVPHFMTRGDS